MTTTQCLYHPDRVAVVSNDGVPLCADCAGRLTGARPPRTGQCRRCGHALVHRQGDAVPDGWRGHRGRGLCGSCYVGLDVRGELADYDRLTRPAEDTIAEYEQLHAAYSDEDIAARLSISLHQLHAVLRRYRRR